MLKKLTAKMLKELGVSRSYASEILSGKRVPSQRLALRIYRAFGVKIGPLEHVPTRDIPAIERLLGVE